MRNRIIVGLGIVVVVIAGFVGFKTLSNAPVTAAQTATPVKAADLGVVTASGEVVPAQSAPLAFKVGGRVVAIPVKDGDQVKQGAVLARLDDSILQKQVAQAKAALQLAQKQLAQVKAGGTAADIAAAQAALDAANENYTKVKQGPTADQLGQLKANLDSAKATVDQAQSAYDRAGGASNPLIGLTRESLQLQQATSAYDAALAAWNDARSHPTAAELAAAASQVQQAQGALTRLKPTQESLDVAQAQVDSAQAALDLAQAQLGDYTLVAPFDGTVANKSIKLGQVVQPGAPAFDLGDLSQLQVETTDLAEVDVTKVNIGQTAKVTFDGLPGKTFSGAVVAIAPEANDHRGDQVYKVKIDLSDAAAAGVRWGMTANVEIATAK